MNLSLLFTQAGGYEVILTASDGYESRTVAKTITAQPLTIRSSVNHTAEWQANHVREGTILPDRQKIFYSGEIFVVDTESSPTAVGEVTSWIDATGIDGNRIQIAAQLTAAPGSTLYKGELFDKKLMSMTEGLPKGLQNIRFRIRYGNGVIKEETVPVRIMGNVNEAVRVHRRQ